MLQLKACLLLLSITAESFLALSSNTCNGHMNLSQEPTGHLGFSPGARGAHRPSSEILICTRTLEIPAGHKVLLKLVFLESGSNMSLACSGGREERTLGVGDTALLRGCERDRATLTWTGAGRSNDAFHLFYYVQGEEESSSTETYPVPRSHPDIATPDPTATTVATEEGPVSDSFLDTSGNSTHNPGPIRHTAPPSTPASTDREVASFPGEESDNGPDTSGAPRRTDIPGRLDFFSTERSTRARSEMYTSQNTELQTVSVSSEAARSGRAYASTELYTNTQTLSHEDTKSLAMSSVGPLLEISSTVLPQNTSRNSDKTSTDSTENWESSGTDVANSPRTQNAERMEESSTHGDYLDTTSSLLEIREHLATIGSTEMPRVVTETGATDSETRHVTLTAQSAITKDSSQATFMSFDLTENSKESTQEAVSTESFLRRQSTSRGTSSPSVVPNWGSASTYVAERATFQTSTTSNLASTVSAFTERGKEEAKTSPGNHVDSLRTSSYFSARTSLLTQPVSTPSQRESDTTYSDVRSAQGFSTASPDTTSTQQTKSEVLPKTESPGHATPSGRTVTASTLSQVSRVPYQTTSGKYRVLPTSAVTGRKGVTTTEVSQRMTSETVHRVTTPTPPFLSAVPFESSTVHQKPKYYIVPDEPVIIKEESFELLLQIIVEESTSGWTEGLEEDTALWLEPYLQGAPGFKELLGVWSSGRAVQCLLQFDTRGALQWLPHTGASSLLEKTGLRQAVREGRSFRTTTVTNITLGGLQEACGWLLQCRSGFTCAFDSRTSDFSCRSLCRSDYCEHHGLCTHHPDQTPVCRCVAGQDFWFMGQRCEVRMTRARLVLSCLAVLLVVVGVVAVLACMAVRRYRALLVQAKVDQTRSSYRRFNHFDELSGRFWLRSWAGSADSLDNPVFSRSDEILQLRALERPCCYHDDSLSLPSTCPSPATHIRTIYPHSSQYAWRGSELSVGDAVLDSGKASDLSVCSWPREPIQWSPFPLLQQLALQRPPAVRVPRTRSCCDGMELVDMNKSWTA